MSNIGTCVRSIRHRRGLSLDYIRDATGLSKGLMSNLENHPDPNPCYNTLKKLAPAFGLSVPQLLRAIAKFESIGMASCGQNSGRDNRAEPGRLASMSKRKPSKLDEALRKRGLLLSGGFRSKQRDGIRKNIARAKKLENIDLQ